MMISEWILFVLITVPGYANFNRPEVYQIPVQSRSVCEKVGQQVTESFMRARFTNVSVTCIKVVEQ